MTLDQALEYVADDEWVEITPDFVRIRKKDPVRVGKKTVAEKA